MRRTILICVLLALAAGPPGLAAAAPFTPDDPGAQLSAFDLVEAGGLQIQADSALDELFILTGSLDAPDAWCQAWLEDGWTVYAADCELLASLGEQSAEPITVATADSETGEWSALGSIALAPVQLMEPMLSLDPDQGGLSLGGEAAGRDVALQLPGWGWMVVGQANDMGFADLDLELEGVGGLLPLLSEYLDYGQPIGVRVRGDGADLAWTIDSLGDGGGSFDPDVDPGGQTFSGGGGSGPLAPLSLDDQDRFWQAHPECPVAAAADRKGRGPYVICVDLTGRSDDTAFSARVPSDDYILRPNRAFVILVRHWEGDFVEIGMTGTSGLYFATDNDLTGGVGLRGGDIAAPRTVITRQQYAPRQPGVASVDVRRNSQQAVHLEFSIQPVYLGAIRVGLGLVFLPPERGYTIVRSPGSQTAEIAVSTGETSSPVAAEVVLGFAPFVFQPHGRGYFGKRGLAQRLAPYIGLGLMQTRPDADSARFSLLSSIYLGFEIELTPTSSLAASFVLARTKRLQAPYKVGGPIEDGFTEVPTALGFMPGAAVVINFSPDFLRFSPIRAGGN
jgi:hypothetical protein